MAKAMAAESWQSGGITSGAYMYRVMAAAMANGVSK
jgi:hypothetical protein